MTVTAGDYPAAWRPVTMPGTAEVRHGYTLDHLHVLAKLAVSRAWSRAANYVERLEAAWYGITEHLCAAAAPPQSWARIEGNLSSLYVYFWRWALWQVFETRQAPGTVAFITPSSYLAGAAYAGMRKHMRQCAGEGWIIDLSPEGHQPKASTRIFPGVQQRICIGILARGAAPDPETPAAIRYAQSPGDRAHRNSPACGPSAAPPPTRLAAAVTPATPAPDGET
jgi:hypothetical protein